MATRIIAHGEDVFSGSFDGGFMAFNSTGKIPFRRCPCIEYRNCGVVLDDLDDLRLSVCIW
jgi:hypothetical protein